MSFKFDFQENQVVNTSEMPMEEVVRILNERGVKLSYGSITLVVEQAALDNMQSVVDQQPSSKKEGARRYVQKYLDEANQKFMNGLTELSLPEADALYQRMVLWEALKKGLS